MKKLGSILLWGFVIFEVLGVLISTFDDVKYAGYADIVYRSLTIEEELDLEQAQRYEAKVSPEDLERFHCYLVCAEVENQSSVNDYFWPDYDFSSSNGAFHHIVLNSSVLAQSQDGYRWTVPAGETMMCRFLMLVDRNAPDVVVEDNPSIRAELPA
jgi:hypothetical protein